MVYQCVAQSIWASSLLFFYPLHPTSVITAWQTAQWVSVRRHEAVRKNLRKSKLEREEKRIQREWGVREENKNGRMEKAEAGRGRERFQWPEDRKTAAANEKIHTPKARRRQSLCVFIWAQMFLICSNYNFFSLFIRTQGGLTRPQVAALLQNSAKWNLANKHHWVHWFSLKCPPLALRDDVKEPEEALNYTAPHVQHVARNWCYTCTGCSRAYDLWDSVNLSSSYNSHLLTCLFSTVRPAVTSPDCTFIWTRRCLRNNSQYQQVAGVCISRRRTADTSTVNKAALGSVWWLFLQHSHSPQTVWSHFSYIEYVWKEAVVGTGLFSCSDTLSWTSNQSGSSHLWVHCQFTMLPTGTWHVPVVQDSPTKTGLSIAHQQLQCSSL